jgi:hypothetical protein
MPRSHQAGHNIDPDRRTFLGYEWRTVIILGAAALLAFAAFTLTAGWPLFLRAALAVLVVGLGLALAVGRIGQLPFEAWLWDVLRFRRSPTAWLKSGERLGFPGAVAWADEAPALDRSASPAQPAPGFFWLSANAIGASAVTGLTIWLAQGGAHQLELLFSTF